ncbi:MAG: hypothetical protein AMJ54_05420 [Deltaproteobacteria bacterium SG8_13]|nr:MAG: hypothetical protein AMJ54_05420 [Deltaproteobacteria bacterium SG8_13]
MSETIEKKQLCRCENCGNEAEMTFVCTLPDEDEKEKSEKKEPAREKAPQQVKGTATCTSCGNEADMWIDL